MRFHFSVLLIAFIFADSIAGCAATTPGAQPHDMSTAQHEAMARTEEKTAKLHTTQYDPNASVKKGAM